MKLRKYLILLLIVIAVMATIRFLMEPSTESPWWIRLIELCYYISPALLAWAVDQSSLKKFIQHYQLGFNGINWRMVGFYVLSTAILYPIFIVLFVYLGGNVLNIDALGRIVNVSYEFTYMGFIFNGLSIGKDVLIFVVNLLFALIYGVTLGALSLLAEEIGWRGFLEKNLSCKMNLKPIFIGLIWTLWGVPFYGISTGISNLFGLLLFNIVLSYYLRHAVNRSQSIWTSAAIRGVISVCTLTVVSPANNGIGYQFVMLLAVICILGITSVIAKNHLQNYSSAHK